jgi:hypothetical protein
VNLNAAKKMSYKKSLTIAKLRSKIHDLSELYVMPKRPQRRKRSPTPEMLKGRTRTEVKAAERAAREEELRKQVQTRSRKRRFN